MSLFTFDIALGREVELHKRVNDSDPTNAGLVMLVLAAAGLEVDATLKTYATLADILAAANNEVTNTNYARKVFTDADIPAPSVDNTTHRTTLSFDVALKVFSTILTGDSWRKLLICYDPDVTGGTDATIVPVTAYDMIIDNAAIVPNGNDINVDFANGYCIAS